MGRFLLGFVVGAAIGAASVILTAPRSGAATRQGIRGTIEGTRDNISGLLSDTVAVARKASAARERELWADFRARLENKGAGS
ncbi:MAG TPA: YtxH domain-containing protein [Kouleothrix sp.]|uniref:YtxH domain-containing protein n=1 Tax=Kouleothrix sp. TaxID=2779161 RepID=UPI002CC2EF87|nr:YtxH domain-containing protein [Kouleothrix sp.]HRC74892.1 YtxH domain-containing protein [Kouleothrix sp.]